MKKILALFIASSLSAETFFTDCSQSAVFLATPCLSWGVDLNILYLQPNNNTYSVELESDGWKIHDRHPHYNLGYEFGLSAFFQERSAEANINYIHYRSDTYSFDAGHIDYGLLINFGPCLKTNFFGGLGLVRLKQKKPTSSLFTGGGPEIGFDFSYGLMDGFQIVDKASGTLFMGSLKYHEHFIHSHHRGILPGMEGKGGLAYTFKLGDCICSFIGGYQILFYWDAIEATDTNFIRHSRHFFLAGPYATFDVAF